MNANKENITHDMSINRFFEQDGYFCEMFVVGEDIPDNQLMSRYRGMFGWLIVCDDELRINRVTKLGFSLRVDLNDWDLNPRYVEFALLGKLEQFLEDKKNIGEV